MPLSKYTPRDSTAVTPIGAYVSPNDTGVIPIRGMTPPASAPALPRRHAPSVPVADRPWRVLLVPPTPGARTRAFDLARWQARVILGTLVMLLLLAAGAVTAVMIAIDGPDLLATNAEVATLRDRLTAVEDSLALARAVLADADSAPTELATLNSPSLKGAPSSARAERRASLLARVRARRSGDVSSSSGLRGIEGLPVFGSIVSGFSIARRHPVLHILRPHLGIDIAAVRGTSVAAPADGRVTYVGRRFSYGLTVDIQHAGGVTTRYAHLRAALVHEGQSVVRGAAIATVGSSGLTTGPHLHYEVAVNGKPVDPLRFRMPRLEDSGSDHGAPVAHGESPAPSAPREPDR